MLKGLAGFVHINIVLKTHLQMSCMLWMTALFYNPLDSSMFLYLHLTQTQTQTPETDTFRSCFGQKDHMQTCFLKV